jgi:hypothetical protein
MNTQKNIYLKKHPDDANNEKGVAVVVVSRKGLACQC